MNTPDKDTIDDVLNQCSEAANSGYSKFPGMTYEQGVEAGLRWMQDDAPNPMED